jgi:hypothetical protein
VWSLHIREVLLIKLVFENSPIPYRRTRFTPRSAKYLILDNFHFCIDPQIINYNGLSFHTSMGLPELGRAVLPFRIYTVELINFVCFTFHTSPLRFFFFFTVPLK